MKKKIVLFAIIFLSICVGYFLGSEKEVLISNQQDSLSINRLEQLLQYIDDDYVEEIDMDSLVGEVIEEIVNRLDPHSVYIPASQRQSIAENMQGKFYGIGVSFFMFRPLAEEFRDSETQNMQQTKIIITLRAVLPALFL